MVQGHGSETRVTVEHVLGVDGGHTVIYGVVHPCQKWSIPRITLIDK